MKIVISLNWAYRNWHLVSFCISIERQNWKSGIWRWDWYWVIVTESRLSSKSVVWTWTYNFVKVLKFHKNILMLGVRCLHTLLIFRFQVAPEINMNIYFRLHLKPFLRSGNGSEIVARQCLNIYLKSLNKDIAKCFCNRNSIDFKCTLNLDAPSSW